MALSANKQKRVEHIGNKFGTLGEQIKILKNYLNGPNPNSINAQLRLTTIATLYKDCVRCNEELTAIKSDHSLIQSFRIIETDYYDIVTTVTQLQNVGPVANSTLNGSGQNFTFTERHENPKLPTIKLPTFDGSPDNWLTFKHKFEALVHSRQDLSNLVKYVRLEESLCGEALMKISEFPPSEENYPKAWEALLEAYDQKRLLVIKHLDALFDLPVVSKATAADLSMLVDKTKQHLHLLKQLEISVSDEVVVRLLERPLPMATKLKWEETLSLDKMPTLAEFYKFINESVFRLRSLHQSGALEPVNKKRAGEPVQHAQTKSSKFDGRSLVTASESPSSAEVPLSCPNCKEDHRLFKCPSFHKLKVLERFEFAKANNICRNCLWTHKPPCKSDKRCKKCKKFQHTLLHFENDSSQTKGQDLNSKDNQSSAPSS